MVTPGAWVHAQLFLGLAFVVEGLLFAFHLKGSALDWSLHFLLVLLVFSAALACFAEYRRALIGLPPQCLPALLATAGH